MAFPLSAASEEAFWHDIRRQFMIPDDEVYLNTGSWGSMPHRAFETLKNNLEILEGNPTRNRQPVIDALEKARASLAEFVHTDPEDIAFLPNVTVAINMVLKGLSWNPGDEILTSDQEYGAIDNAVHHTHLQKGVKIIKAPIPIPAKAPHDIVDAFRPYLSDKTRLILCSHIATRTGLITPIKALADLAHEHGAMLAVDGAHGPGMVPLDLTDWGCDFYGGNCHKWLCAPKGTGFLFVRPDVQHKLTHTIVSWGYSREGAQKDDTGKQVINNRPFMWQLEHWGTRDMAPFCAVADAVAIQQEIGPERILSRVQTLADYAREQLLALRGTTLLTPTHKSMSGALSTFHYAGLDPKIPGEELYPDHRITTPLFPDSDGVGQRVSTHIYNSFKQIDVLVNVMTEMTNRTKT